MKALGGEESRYRKLEVGGRDGQRGKASANPRRGLLSMVGLGGAESRAS